MIPLFARRRFLLSAGTAISEAFFQVISKLTEEATPATNVGSSQGVATDGTWFFTTGNDTDQLEIRVFNSSWTEQTGGGISPHQTDSDFGSHAQVNGMYCDRTNGKLYVGSNNFPTTPELGWILEYNVNANTGALSFVTEHSVGAFHSEGCTFYNDKFWVFGHTDSSIRRFSTSWSLEKTYTYPIAPTHGSGYYQGGMFLDDVFYGNVHGNSGGGFESFCYDQNYDRLLWTMTSLTPPTDCTQGIDLDGTNLYMAERTSNDHTTPNNVVRASFIRTLCPPLYVGGDENQDETLSANNFAISAVTPPDGINRLAVFFASWEMNAPASAQYSTDLTWGVGNSATKVTDLFNPNATSTHNGLTIWYMKEEDIPSAAANVTLNLKHSIAGNDTHLAVAVFQDVDQAMPFEQLVVGNALSVSFTTLNQAKLGLNMITNGNAGTSTQNNQIALNTATLSEFVSIFAAKPFLIANTYSFGWADGDSDRPISSALILQRHVGSNPLVASGQDTVNATSFTLNPLVLGAADGDTMVVSSLWEDNSTITKPGGWSTLFDGEAPSTTTAHYLVQTITFSGTPPTSVSWSYGATAGIAYSYFIIRGPTLGALRNLDDTNNTANQTTTAFKILPRASGNGAIVFALGDGVSESPSAVTGLTNMDLSSLAYAPVSGRHALSGYTQQSVQTTFFSGAMTPAQFQLGWIPLLNTSTNNAAATYTDSWSDTANQSSYESGSLAINQYVGAATRKLIMGIGTRCLSGGVDVTSVKIHFPSIASDSSGSEMTRLHYAVEDPDPGGQSNYVAFWGFDANTTGNSANTCELTITLNQEVLRIYAASFDAKTTNLTPYDTNSDVGSAAANYILDIGVPDGNSFVLGLSLDDVVAGTWTGITERDEVFVESGVRASVASDNFTLANTSLAITNTNNSGVPNVAISISVAAD